MTAPFRLLVLTDAHYVHPTDAAQYPPARHCDMGCEILTRAIHDARARGRFDAIALLGDLVNDGTSAATDAALADLTQAVKQAAGDVPVLVVPGNHDAAAKALLGAFETRAGVHEIGGYRFIAFADPYGEGDWCSRRADDLALLDALGDGGPVVALQHNPMAPAIDSPYPYMLTNREQVLAAYARRGVLLSLSGHYHHGQEPTCLDGVTYFTAPSLCDRPHRYAIVTLAGRDVTIETRRLQLTDEDPRVVDCHAHTEFAYCADPGLRAAGVIERAKMFGAAGVVFTEHAPQLYMAAEDFWKGRHVFEPAVWRSPENDRVAEFYRFVEPLRDEFVQVGFEVELDVAGDLTVRDADRAPADLLVGAIHWVRKPDAEMTDAEAAAQFMADTQALCETGIDVLAHPWRYFRRRNRPCPRELYGELADILAGTNVAAEINYHTNDPDPAFFAECIARNVPIALASDGHHLREAGAFTPHLACLRKAAGADANPANCLMW